MDLAILKVTDITGANVSDIQAATFVSTESAVHLGQFAIMLGSAQSSLQFMQTMGTISQKNIAFNSSGDNSTSLPYYRIDASVTAGFSGGPTFDLQGNVFAITTATENFEN